MGKGMGKNEELDRRRRRNRIVKEEEEGKQERGQENER